MKSNGKTKINSIRLTAKESKELDDLRNNLNITKTEVIRILLDTYQKSKDNNSNTLIDYLKFKEENIYLAQKVKLLEEIVDIKKISIEKLRKELLKVLEENMIIQSEIEELKLKINKIN